MLSGNTAKFANAIIYDYVECLNRGDYAEVCTLICDSKRAEYEAFVQNGSNIKNHLGLFNYKSASLVSVKPYNGDAFSLDEYEDISNLCFWECIINVETYEDNEFLTSGLNYFIIVTEKNATDEIHIMEIIRDIRETATLCEKYMAVHTRYFMF